MNTRITMVLGGTILILAASVAFAGKPPPTGITSVNAGPGLQGGGSSGAVTLALKSCGAGQALVWDGVSAWQCQLGGDVTGVTAGEGLAGGGNSSGVTLSLKACQSGDILRSTGTGWACETPQAAGRLYAMKGGNGFHFVHSEYARLRNDPTDGLQLKQNQSTVVAWYATTPGPAAGWAAGISDCLQAGWFYIYVPGFAVKTCSSAIVGTFNPLDADWDDWVMAAEALGSSWSVE